MRMAISSARAASSLYGPCETTAGLSRNVRQPYRMKTEEFDLLWRSSSNGPGIG